MVTGCAGFIGSTLSEALLVNGHRVVGIDNLSDYYDRALKSANVERLTRSEEFTFLEDDLCAMDLTSAVTTDVEAICHLAGQPGVRLSWGDDFGVYTRSNVDATQRLLDASRDLPRLRRFVYASSSSVYGLAETYPTNELTLPRPFSPYGVTKLAGEHLASLYRYNFGLPVVAFRLFTVYGPRQRPDMAFTRFLRAARANRPIVIYGSGEQIRDFTFVDDVVSACVRACEVGSELPAVMNLSGGSSVTVNEVLDMIAEITERPLHVVKEKAADGDVFRTGGDNALARQSLEWEPRTSLDLGLSAQKDWIYSTD